MSQKSGNPAVVGLAGFGLTTLLLQFVNVGWMDSNSPVFFVGLIFGGLAQMIAGFQEKSCGNNFGYSAFVSYGCFWIALCGIWAGNTFGFFKSTPNDVGFFLTAWTLYTAIMTIASLRVHKAMAFTFITLLIGFILLDIEFFTKAAAAAATTPEAKEALMHKAHTFGRIAGFELMVCAGAAWYMMAAVILADLAGRPVLPVGKPILAAATPAH